MYQNTLLKEIGCLYPISMARFSPQLLSVQAVAGIQANILKDGIKASYFLSRVFGTHRRSTKLN